MKSSSMVCMVGLLIVVLICTSSLANGCGITVQNRCDNQVIACAQHGNSDISQYDLAAGESIFLDFGSSCTWIAGAIYGSVQGKCAVDGYPSAATDRNYANLAEFTIDILHANWNSQNAYSHPLAIRPVDIANGETPSGYRCGSPSCFISDISSFCQPNNVLYSFSTGASSCVNTDGTVGLGPTDGTKVFKGQCADSYSYNFDDATSTFTCGTGTNYEVVFCP
ncbi:hypothetical protein R1flu_009230 [Riccia fluitans]|uniref:Thaumatin-like protein n=1 Tax=Riccia fluitans TaxID=41844 RepID=A0ABD1Z2B4_9MARC